MPDNHAITSTNSTKRSSLKTTDPLTAKANTTVAYTDGACKGNPGAGGWGAHLIFSDGRTQDLYGGESMTTNNRMELMGAIKALEYSSADILLEIWTDSSYVKNGITDWIEGWKKRGWKTSSKKPVANQDLWQNLDESRQGREVEWHWVKGHAGHAGNEKADELANLGVTSSNEQDFATIMAGADNGFTEDHSKKKADGKPTVLNAAIDANDWLHFDPLGLDDCDDSFNSIEEDDGFELGLEDESSFESEYQLKDTLASEPEMAQVHSTSQPYQSAGDSKNLVMNSNDSPATITTTANDASAVHATDITSTDMTANTNLPNAETETTSLPKFDGDTSRANPHFQPLLPKPIHRNESNRQLIMDTETTGLDALKGDRVIEVGIVEMIGRKFTGEKLHVYINPQRGMDEEVIRIHGISEAFLTDKPTFDKVAQSLYDFMDGAEIIAHNASFDMNFLNMEFAKVGLADFAQRVQVTDSLLMAKQQYPGQKNTLDALVRRLNVGKQDRTFHGALLDSEILAEVYLAMTGGQVSLAIEEDSDSEGGQTTHSSFANLAALLLDSSSDENANRDWFVKLAEDYPEMNTSLSNW